MTVLVDHLVVAARTLEDGVAWCEATLGVTPGPGGRHVLMSTHNRLLKIATEAYPNAYLEIVAIDPDAPPPGRARWFEMDEPLMQQRLQAGPRLVHVVARSQRLAMDRASLITLGQQPGEPVKAGRDTPQGRLEWEILLRDDGRMGCGGALPTLLQWSGRHPAEAMPASGVVLHSLALAGVPDRARDALQLSGVAVSSAPGTALRAVFDTPLGPVTLESFPA